MPGADTVLVFRMSRAHGVRTGLTTAIGVVTGPVIWGVLSGIGAALILARNATAYTLLALFGALYLLYLAVGCFRLAASQSTAAFDVQPDGDSGIPPKNSYVTGLLTNLLNPKIGVFYLSVMPELFQGRHLDLWVGGSLGLIQSCIGFAFLSCVALLTGKARRYLAGNLSNMVVESLAGLCLLAFAVYSVWSVLYSAHT
jgi:threonine/homoserine/homoserine lactone efflux protein